MLDLLRQDTLDPLPSLRAVESIHLHLLLNVLLLQLLQELCHGLHHRDLVPPALGAVPLAYGLRGELHAVKVEPLDGAEVVVAADHVPVGHLFAQTVGGFVVILIGYFMILHVVFFLIFGWFIIWITTKTFICHIPLIFIN